jgi:ribosomal protein L22
MSARKVRRVIDLVRGQRAVDALTILKFDPHAASRRSPTPSTTWSWTGTRW